MVAKMRNEKNSLVLLSSKRTKADTRTRADEAFALPSFPEAAESMFKMELPPRSCKEVATERHHGKDLENLKQTMLQHEAMFKEQVRELHRLYQVQRLLMAASRGKVVNTSSDPASSSSSLVNSSEFSKPGQDRSPLEAVSGPKIEFTQKSQDLTNVPGQLTPFDHQMHVNATKEGVQHFKSFESLRCHMKEPSRRTFDLERPAEEYIDVEYGEEKSPEGCKLPNMTCVSKVSHLTAAPVSQSPFSRKDACWSPSTGFGKESVDNFCRGLSGKTAVVAEGNGADNQFLFLGSCSGDTPSLSMLSARLDGPSQEALAFHTPVLSTKSLLGGLLRHKDEGQSEDKISTDIQGTHFAQYQERRVERLSEAETDQRATRENSTPPQWFLKGQACPKKALSSQAMSQNLGWHQPLPFFWQKQDDHALPRKHSVVSEKNSSPTESQEVNPKGNAWPNVGKGFHNGQMCAMGSQGMPLSGLSSTGGTHLPYRFFPQAGDRSSQSIPVVRDDKGAHVFPLFMSNYPSMPAVDMPAPVLDAQAAASLVFPLGFSSRGSAHNSTTQPWFQQNGISSPIQLQHVAKLESGSLPLTCERSLPGDYKGEDARLLGSANVFGSDLHAPSDVTDDTSYSKLQAVPLRPEVPSKGTAFGNRTSRTDVELTLGLSTNKANKDPPCFVQQTVKQEQVDRLLFPVDRFESKSPTEKVQLREINGLFSELCAGNAETKAACDGFQHGSEITKIHADSNISVLELGLVQKSIDSTVRERKKSLSPDVVKVKEVPNQQRKGQIALSLLPEMTSERQGQNLFQIAIESPREQLCLPDELDVVSSLGESNDGNSKDKRDLNENRHGSAFLAECAFSDVAANNTFGRISRFKETTMQGRSSDIPAVTSCDIREAIPTESFHTVDEVNSDYGEACQSHESGHVCCESQKVLLTPSSRIQTAAEVCGNTSIPVKTLFDTYISPTVCSSLPVFKSETETHPLSVNEQDGGDDRESDTSRKHENEVLDQSKQAAEVLLSLAFDLSSVLQKMANEDNEAHNQERSLEWFANVIPRDDELGMRFGRKDAAGSIQPVETFEGIRSAFEQLGEATSRNSEVSVENRPHKAQSPKKLDFFETVTLMLKASGLDTDEINLQATDRWQMEGECQSVTVHSGRSSRRGRVGKDFQREMLPSIASLSRQEITEDIQMLGGLVRSATEMVAKRGASCLPLKEDSWTQIDIDSIIPGGTKSHCMNLVTKSSMKDETENRNGFLKISSWGELTRRRRMRRQRSQWSLLPLGIGIPSP